MAAPGFTSEEVQARINEFIQTSISVDRTKTGARDIVSARNQVFDLVATTFLFRPEAFFYLVWLARNRVKALQAQQASAVATILEKATSENLGRRTQPVRSTTELVNARAALVELSGGLSNRTQGIQGAVGPAVDRFKRSTEKFIRGELTKNVLVSSTPTETPQELRTSIASLWATSVERHTKMVELLARIRDALDVFGSVRLPERAVRTLVNNVRTRLEALTEEMGSDSAVEKSREAFLELFTMRTLLTKASSFKAPSQRLAPLTSSSAQTVELVAGEGDPASLLGATSGPYSYDDGTVLSLQTQTPTVSLNINLPGSSNAEYRSQPLAFPLSFGGSDELALIVDGTSLVTSSALASGVYASGAALASAVDGVLTGATATFDATTNELVVRSDSTGDESSLEWAIASSNQLSFFNKLQGSLFTPASPIGAEDVVQAIASQTTAVDAEVVRTVYGQGALATLEAASPAQIRDERFSGADLGGTAGETTAASTTMNFEALGVRSGDGLRITSGPAVGSYAILAVSENSLTVDPAPLASFSGSSFVIGPDYRNVPVGASVNVGATAQDFRAAGRYRVAVGADVGLLPLDRAPSTLPTTCTYNVLSEYVRLSAKTADPLDGITAWPASDGATALGLPTSSTLSKGAGKTVAYPTGSTGNFLDAGVRPGDTFTPAAGAPQEIATVSAGELTLAEGLDLSTFAGTFSFTIDSARVSAYDTLRSSLSSWLEDHEAITAVDFAVSRLIRGANPTSLIRADILDYQSALETLGSSLSAYTVPREVTIDNILQALGQQGMDRALDLLLNLDLDTFFSMDVDSVSYSTHLTRQAANTTREVAPVTRTSHDESLGAQSYNVISSWRRPFSDVLTSGEE